MAFRAFVVEKRPREQGEAEFESFFACCVLFYFGTLAWVLDLFPFFQNVRIILHTAVRSEGMDLLAKTPELTPDMSCEDMTQMTTWYIFGVA